MEIRSEENVAKAVVIPDIPLTNAQKWASRVVRFGRDGLRKPPVHPPSTSQHTSKSRKSTLNSHQHHTKTDKGSTKKSTSPDRNLRHKWAGALVAYLFRLKPTVTHSLIHALTHCWHSLIVDTQNITSFDSSHILSHIPCSFLATFLSSHTLLYAQYPMPSYHVLSLPSGSQTA